MELWWGTFIQSRKCMSLKFTDKFCVMTMKNDAKFWRGIDWSVQNLHKEFDEVWPEHLKISKIYTLMGFFWTKYMFELKKVYGSYVWWHWILIQHLKENLLVLSKLTWGIIASFHQSTFEVYKFEVWWDPFIQSRKCMSLKFTGEFCVMTMKNDTKFEQELTCQFKIDMRNLTFFDPSTRKSQKFAL